MPFNGSGVYTFPANTFNPAVTGQTINPTDWNADVADLASAISTAICKDGQTTTTARIPFSNGIQLDSITSLSGGALTISQAVSLSSTLAVAAAINGSQGADIASASTINLDTATGNVVDVTGTTTITAITLSQGRWRWVRFTGALILTNGASLVLPGAANITTVAGDYALFIGYASSVVRALFFRGDGTPIVAQSGFPQGRLTLTSATPVMTADATAQTTVYYTPYQGRYLPIYNGTYFVPTAFSEVSVALDSNNAHTGYQQSGKNFDLFVYNDAGTIRVGTGPAWSSDTARGTGAGTTELQQLQGIWTNKNAITLRFGSASGNTTAVVANQASYVGTMRATADGQTGMAFQPAAANNGTNNILGLWNAYNRVQVMAICRDNTSSWNYQTVTIRAANGSSSNRISWVDGLQQSAVFASYQDQAKRNASSTFAYIGMGLDSTSTFTTGIAELDSNWPAGQVASLMTQAPVQPQLGFHFMSANEVVGTNAGSITFLGTANDSGTVAAQSMLLILRLDM